MIAFLWAEDKNGLIGKGGTLPWYLPNDLKFFKQMTINQAIVMGRKTFEGMGETSSSKSHQHYFNVRLLVSSRWRGSHV